MKKQFGSILIAVTCIAGTTWSVRAEKVDFKDLPRPVQDAVRAQAGAAPIEDIDRTTKNGRTVYEVAFKKNGQHTELQVTESGAVLNAAAKPQARKITWKEVPPVVQNAIRTQAGASRIEDLEVFQKKGLTIYNAAYKRAGQHVELYVTHTGALVDAEGNRVPPSNLANLPISEKITLDQVPTPVRTTLQSQAGTAVIEDIDMRRENGKLLYGAAFKRDGKNVEVIVGEDGSIVNRQGQKVAGTATPNPLLSQKVTWDQVPESARNTILSLAGSARVEDIDLIRKSGKMIYNAAYKKNGKTVEVYVTDDGTIVDQEGGTLLARVAPSAVDSETVKVSWNEIPVNLQQRMRQQAGPGALITDVNVLSQNGQVFYTASFTKDGKEQALYLNQQGQVVDNPANAIAAQPQPGQAAPGAVATTPAPAAPGATAPRKVTMNELPPAVQNTVRAQVGAAQVEDIDQRVMNGRVVYEVAYKQNGQHVELLVADDGSILRTDTPAAASPQP